ncbi:MAG TPA: HTH domain-containing protein [Actinomycetota bacterium]|nr:HTH domain-containing protein [Actinomycetota bacterium]
MIVDYLDAAVQVLREQGKPLHWTVIQDIALQRGYLDPFTQKDIRKHLLTALSEAARRSNGPVVKADRGVYALRDP